MPLFRKRQPGIRFGKSLKKFDDVPFIVRQICDYIFETSLDVEGILHTSGNQQDVEKIRKLYEKQSVVNLNDYPEPHTVCSVLKMFLSELKGGVVNEETTLRFVSIAEQFSNNPEERLKRYCDMLSRMPMQNRRTLVFLIDFLHEVAKNEENEMSPERIGIVFAPIIFRFPNGDANAEAIQKGASDVLAQMIEDAPKLKRKFGFRFGGPIDDFDDVPGIVRQICEFIAQTQIHVEGILGKSGNKDYVNQLLELYEKQSVVNLNVYPDQYAPLNVLKKFLRELEGGVVNEETTLRFVSIAEDFPDNPKRRVERYCDVLLRMPIKNLRLLVFLIEFLHEVANNESENGMSHERIGIVFAPIIFRLPNGDASQVVAVASAGGSSASAASSGVNWRTLAEVRQKTANGVMTQLVKDYPQISDRVQEELS